VEMWSGYTWAGARNAKLHRFYAFAEMAMAMEMDRKRARGCSRGK
jgi:hypothetical protein